MSRLNMVTLSSGLAHLASANGNRFQNLRDVQELLIPKRKSTGQGWTFIGDHAAWQRSVAKTFHAR